MSMYSGLRARVLIVSVLVVALGLPVFAAAQGRRERFDPNGSFWIYGKPPMDFENFGGINLNPKRKGYLPPSGVNLTSGTRLRFKLLTVARDKFTFTTVVIRGISYGFTGRFLKGGVFAAADLNEETPVLEGTLTKFKSGQKVAEARLKFTYFGGT